MEMLSWVLSPLRRHPGSHFCFFCSCYHCQLCVSIWRNSFAFECTGISFHTKLKLLILHESHLATPVEWSWLYLGTIRLIQLLKANWSLENKWKNYRHGNHPNLSQCMYELLVRCSQRGWNSIVIHEINHNLNGEHAQVIRLRWQCTQKCIWPTCSMQYNVGKM